MGFCFIVNFFLTAKTSTSIEASWQLPPADSRNRTSTGFTLYYKKKGSSGPSTQINIDTVSTLTKVVTGLDKFTEYQFDMSAFSSVGDGPNGTVISHKASIYLMSVRTKEDGK